ncbi:MAG: TIGR03943 family protein [Propionicimonas sp.]|nr:TIGR03943 family protein [Propionicimonas sp.]
MSSEPPRRRPPAGLLLGLIGIVATCWLAATGQLGLYIHPRYFVFTTVAVVLALVATVVAFALLPGDAGDDHDDHDHAPQGRTRRRLRGAGTVLAGLALVVGLLVIPPATLSTATLEQRDLNSSLDTDAVTLVGADPAGFALRDWAALVANPSTALGYAGQQATLSGFVTPSPDGNPDVLYLARFVVTCCTVDAQPVGVPVAVPGWADTYPVDGWLEVTGTFVATSDGSSTVIVLKPSTLESIEIPAQPYDF